MLKEIQRKISVNEGVLANANRKCEELKNDSKHREAYWYWLGVACGVRSVLKDLQDLQEQAEQEVSSVDHFLDALRGL